MYIRLNVCLAILFVAVAVNGKPRDENDEIEYLQGIGYRLAHYG